MKVLHFNGILAWVLFVGVALVCIAILMVNVFDRRIIEQAAAENLHAEFLRAAGSVSRIIRNAGDLHDDKALREAFQDIMELRPGIRRLEVYDIASGSGTLILSSDPQYPTVPLSVEERTEVVAGRSVVRFDDAVVDRAWMITAPIMMGDHVVGALRGRFSLWKYDRLISKEATLARDVGVGAVVISCAMFLTLIRIKVHKPISRLLDTMRQAEAGDLMKRAPVVGPSDIQAVSGQFNRLLDRVRDASAEKERLLAEIQDFNKTLMTKIAAATEELRQANLMLVESRTQAERAEKLAALGEFSAMVAHELGTPLSAISGHVQMLTEETDPQGRERRVAIIRSEIVRMAAIIRHVLDSTYVQMQSAAVDLDEIVNEVLALISIELPGKRITLRAHLADPLPAVAGDRTALKGVLFNLVTNAVQAMPHGGELVIRAAQILAEPPDGTIVLAGGRQLNRGAVRLSVRDTGQGIATDTLGRIFEPFFTTRAAGGGTGLGLAICHRVVATCGGRLAVWSVVDQGTMLTMDLPVWFGEGTNEN